MAGSKNKIIIVGNVGIDPEIMTFQNGKEVAKFTVATSSELGRDKTTGEKMEKTEWHKVAIYSEGLINIVKKYVKKGMKLYIEGSLQTRQWVDKQGLKRSTTEVVIQGYNGTITMLDRGHNSNYTGSNYTSTNNQHTNADNLEYEEVPFNFE